MLDRSFVDACCAFEDGGVGVRNLSTVEGVSHCELIRKLPLNR